MMSLIVECVRMLVFIGLLVTVFASLAAVVKIGSAFDDQD